MSGREEKRKKEGAAWVQIPGGGGGHYMPETLKMMIY